jgi:hypothetical protein
MTTMTTDQLVTVMGGAAATNPSWIKPLPDLFSGTKMKWDVGKKPAAGATSWLR